MKISVVTVCKNSAKTLERTIKSVLDQEYYDLEYIIIDGGSTDGTQDIIKKYEKNISYWISETDEGLFFAMNKGISLASGEIVAILNSDDYYNENTLNRIGDLFKKNDVEIVAGNAYTIYYGRRFPQKYDYEEEKEIHYKIIYSHPAFFVKKSAYERVGLYNTEYKYSADYEWMIRAFDKKIKLLKVEDYFTNCEAGGTGFSNLCKAVVEQKEAALQNVNGVYDVEFVKSYYAKEMDNAERIYLYAQACKDIEFLNKATSINTTLKNISNQGCFIWGTGRYGEEIYDLLQKVSVKINGFIDNNKNQDYFHNIKVLDPIYLEEKEIPVIIATLEFEDPIEKQIREIWGEELVVYKFSDIIVELVDEYKMERGYAI